MLKGYDESVDSSELLGFWTLSISTLKEPKEHNVLETGSVSILRLPPPSMGPNRVGFSPFT
jgi:hypothetical protein